MAERAVNQDSARLATSFQRLLGECGNIMQVDWCPVSTGNIALEVKMSDGFAILEFDADGSIYANVDIGEDKYDYDILGFDGESMPEQLTRFFPPSPVLERN